MTGKPKLLTIILFFILCAGLLPLLAWPLPYEGLDWLALGQAIAAYGTGEKKGDDSSPPPDEVNPGQAKEVHDPETPSITVFFPADATSEPITVRTYYADLPAGVADLPDAVSSPFFFGAWIRGEGRTVDRFNTSIRLTAPYDDSQIASIAEEELRLYMYNPAIEAWVKLCGLVDPHRNAISGLILIPTAFEEGGNSLFAIGFDQTPSLEQFVDAQGKTRLSVPEANLSLGVLPGTVEPGAHFEITFLPTIPDGGAVKLLANPVDVKACQIDHTDNRNSRQLAELPKPIQVEFDYAPEVAIRAGGAANLTSAILEGGQWTNLELLGYPVIGSDNTISVETDILGTFSLAVR